MEHRSPAFRQMEALRERVVQLGERLAELRVDTQNAVGELRSVSVLADAADEEDMLRRIDESLLADDERVQGLQLLELACNPANSNFCRRNQARCATVHAFPAEYWML